MRLVRRLFVLGVLGGVGWALMTALQRSKAAVPETAGSAAPVTPPPTRPATRPTVQAAASPPSSSPSSTASTQAWAEPVDGACPEGYPIKGNASSGIYHVPGGRFYERTIPERCYATAGDAEADGYRPAKA